MCTPKEYKKHVCKMQLHRTSRKERAVNAVKKENQKGCKRRTTATSFAITFKNNTNKLLLARRDLRFLGHSFCPCQFSLAVGPECTWNITMTNASTHGKLLVV